MYKVKIDLCTSVPFCVYERCYRFPSAFAINVSDATAKRVCVPEPISSRSSYAVTLSATARPSTAVTSATARTARPSNRRCGILFGYFPVRLVRHADGDTACKVHVIRSFFDLSSL